MLAHLLNQHTHCAVNYVPNLGQLQMQNTQRCEIRIQPIRYNDRRYDLPIGMEMAAIITYISPENESIIRRDIFSVNIVGMASNNSGLITCVHLMILFIFYHYISMVKMVGLTAVVML